MKKLKLWLMIVVAMMLIGCGGGGSKGGKSTFSDSNNSPTVASVVENNNTATSDISLEGNNTVILPSLLSIEQNETDIIAYVRENTQKAFQVKGKDKSNIKYYLSTGDSRFCKIDPLNGEVFFDNPTDYETKPLYIFNVVLEDSVGHRTVKRVTIHIVDTKNEEPIEVINSNTPLIKEEEKYFITTWDVLETNENKLTIPTLGDGYNYSVDWGDGNSTTQVTTNAEHTYDKKGVYTIKILGDFPRFRANELDIVNQDGKLIIRHNSDKSLKSTLKSIEQWGTIKWKSLRFSFADTRIAINASDTPDLSTVKDMTGMFLNLCAEDTTGYTINTSCGSMDLNNWDVSKVTNMSRMFYNANFKPNISDWNVSSVVNMSRMFSSYGSFRYPGDAVTVDISKWDVSNVINMSYMFAYNDSFDENIKKWDTSSVRDMSYLFAGATPYRPTSFTQDIGKWDVSNVEDMGSMFEYAVSFNQDIGKWNVSNVKNMSKMFYGEAWTSTTFNKNISSWNVLNVKDMSFMFHGNASFNQDLESWNVTNNTNTSWMFENTLSLEKTPSWYK